MKYFTKILSVFLCAAEISVLAQLPNAPLASAECKKALASFNESSAGKTLEKCSNIINGKKEEFCSQCANIGFPNELKNACKTSEDEAYLNLVKTVLDTYNGKMSDVCKSTSKTQGSTSTKVPQTTVAPSNSTTTITKTHTQTQVPVSATSTPSATKSATKTAQQSKTTQQQPTQGAQQPATGAQQPATGVQQPATGAQQPATGAQPAQGVNPTDPQLSQVPLTDPIGNSNTNTNQPVDGNVEDLNSSATKLGYTLVAAFALAAFNLLL